MVTVLRRPHPALAPFVDRLWYVDEPVSSGFERRLPTGGMQIVVNLAADELRWYDDDRCERPHEIGGAGLSGPIALPIGIDIADQRRTVGVAFRPGGAAPFFGPPAEALTQPLIELEDLWSRAGAVLRERLVAAATPAATLALLESCLLDQAIGALAPDRALGAAVQALEQGCPVHQVVDRTGMSPSTLGRMFRRLVGLSPKPYARLRRLQRVLDTVTGPGGADEPDWATVATGHGYYDQAHLINEFRALTGRRRTRTGLARTSSATIFGSMIVTGWWIFPMQSPRRRRPWSDDDHDQHDRDRSPGDRRRRPGDRLLPEGARRRAR